MSLILAQAPDGAVRAIIMVGLHMGADECQRRHQNREVVSEADAEYHIGNRIDRQHEIAECGEEYLADSPLACVLSAWALPGLPM